MKTRIAPFALVLLLASTAAVAATGAVAVKTAKNATLGSIVVSAKGMTLYHRAGKAACTGACASLWPPLLVTGTAKPVAGKGIVAAKLGTVKRPDGKVQVTYAGSPLYLYSGDTAVGETKGEAVGGVWFALAPSGASVKPAAAAPASTGPSTTTTTTPGYGY